MNALEQMALEGLVPVVAFHSEDAALPAARAVQAGGLGVLEITLRTQAGLACIRRVSRELPDMLVGAGTVLSVEMAQQAVENGAAFLVTPGFNPEVVEWCVRQNVAVLPGCVTPSEIQQALSLGQKTLKFFPAGAYGGDKTLRALDGPFGPLGVRFVPTGGIDEKNLADYAGLPCVAAVGGGWLCSGKAVANEDFEGITQTVRRSVDVLLGFQFAHIGINAGDSMAAERAARELENAFHFPAKNGTSSHFASKSIEVCKGVSPGRNGHMAIATNSIPRALYHLEKRGYTAEPDSRKEKDGRTIAIYLRKEFGGFAAHLLQQ